MDKIICIGKNYQSHAREVGLALEGEPVLFLKPPSVLRQAGNGATLELRIPPDATSIEHECEVVLKLGTGAYQLSAEEAQRTIVSFTLGLDMTRRDLQAGFRSRGEPWTASKVFIDAAAVGSWIDVAELSAYSWEPFKFSVNGTLRQKATLKEMSLSPAQCIALASRYLPLLAGDLVFTGSPSGTGRIEAGDIGGLEWGRISYGVRWDSFLSGDASAPVGGILGG